MNRALRIIVGGILLSVNLQLNAAEVIQQQSPAQSSPPSIEHNFPRKTMRWVWPHELMNFQERYDLWLKMRSARSPTERIELWAKKYAQLEKRANKLGVGLREPDVMMMRYENRYPAIREENRWEMPTRENNWPIESPNLGYGPRYEPMQPRYEGFRPFPPMGR